MQEVDTLIANDFYVLQGNIKQSFSSVKKDIKKMQKEIASLKEEMHKKDEAVRNFLQESMRVRLALSQLHALQQTLVVKRDLKKIKREIVSSIKRTLKGYEKKVALLKKELRLKK